MTNIKKIIEELKEERDKHIAEIQRIDDVLAAYRLLVTENILPPSDNDDEILTKMKGAKNNGLFAGRKRSIQDFIAQYRKKIFTIPDIVHFTNINRRRVKIEVDKMIANGELKIITKGKKGRAGKYKLIKST